jgi:hypothetical protein
VTPPDCVHDYGRLSLLWAGSSVVSVAVAMLMRRLACTLHPRILDLEFAATPLNAKLLLETWGHENRRRARTVLILDYLLLAGYGAAGWSLAKLVTDFACLRNWQWLARLGPVAAWLMIAGAAFDAIENLGALIMISAVGRGGTRRWPLITSIFSVAKFVSIVIVLQYFFAAFVHICVDSVLFYERLIAAWL